MELIIGISITSLLTVVLGGLMMAVQTARDHAEGLEAATTQAAAAVNRIRWMITGAGVYQLPGEPAVLGLAVVNHQAGTVLLPDVLVVWSGGRSGGMAAEGVRQRLPRVQELVIYAPDPVDPSRLVEITIPGDAADVDFRDPDFDSRILTLIESAAAEPVLLCDRIRRSALDQVGGVAQTEAANVRFELTTTPDDEALTGTTPGTAEWYDLPWAQGIASGQSGMRQATVRMELQVQRRPYGSPGTGVATASIPFFGSAGYRYVYSP